MVRYAVTASLLVLIAAEKALAVPPWMGQLVVTAPDIYEAAELGAPDPKKSQSLFSKAAESAVAGRLSDAFELATQAYRADPGNADARRVLGYETGADGEPLTPYQATQLRRGNQWTPRYGWLKPDEVARYEAGERRAGRRWITAEQDAALHTEILDGWTVRTDHFAVTTNHSLEAGARLAAELEGLFQVWRQWFAGYWLSEREIQALFAGDRAARKRSRPMRVFYHRDKTGYVEHLRRRQPRIAQTLGIYFDDLREAHFYAPADEASEADRELARATLYHEAAHQLFAENGPGRPGAGRDANFWLVEGAACYFELLAPVEGEAKYTLGNPAQGRLPSAVAHGPALPLARLAAQGQTDFQRLEELPAVYAQATGLVALFRHGARAETDREALVETLRAVYSRRDRPDELPRQAERSAEELDQEYRQFLDDLVGR